MDQEQPPQPQENERRGDRPQAGLLERIRGLHLQSWAKRYGRHASILAVLVVGLWAARLGLNALPVAPAPSAQEDRATTEVTPTPTQEAELTLADLPAYDDEANNTSFGGVTRKLDIHTVIPSRPRLEVVTYEVQEGDTLFGIADQYGLKPETILWGNYEELQDSVHALQPGQSLNILPVDGTYYQWHEGDTLTGVGNFFGVEPQTIVDWPGNDLDPSMDYEDPDIEPGTWLVVPGGQRELVTWQAPRVYRSNPAAARVIGPGYCGEVIEGAIGTATFVWPAPGRQLSGYGYSSIHPAIDIGGATGNAIYASDQGVVVYSGWNNYGYGNLVILDHGNGWQTLYAHLSSLAVSCGQSVFQGTVIGAMGCTGNCSGSHLHFEMQSDVYGKVNPVNFLP